MTSSSAVQMREWAGPAILSFGFRPFFFLGSVWAAMAMALWIAMFSSWIELPTAFDPVSWHANAMIIGYLGAIVAGFLLTAVPNWTGRLPVVGWKLGALVLLWLAGRVAIMISALMPATIVAVLDLASLIALALMLTREIVAGKNWRNLIVLALLLTLIIGGGLFHWQAANGEIAAQGSGFRLCLAAAIMLISVIGGRIVPSFTRNWLVKTGHTSRPASPMSRFDKMVIFFTIASLALWVVDPTVDLTGAALFATGLLQLVRLARWSGLHTRPEPLVWVLHIAYAFVPVGALALGASILWPELIGLAAAQHLWMAGAIGLMTLGVMTRATLGHTGHDLHATAGTTILYLAVIGAVLSRLIAGSWSAFAEPLYIISALLWCVAFLGFATLYGPLLLQSKAQS